MFVAGSESTAVALTWLWVALDANPQVAARLVDEVEVALGGEPVNRSHLPRLGYTKMVLSELLRLYPVGWIIPRTVVEPDAIDGVRIDGGSTVVVSPYLTNRLRGAWERPDTFDPDRFAPEPTAARHRFAYLSFGAGPHQCLGSHFFTVEAQLIVAAILRRYRPVLTGPRPIAPRPVMTLKPSRQVILTLAPAAAA
jgi:cytochrome P450